jgi:hypothetical protein
MTELEISLLPDTTVPFTVQFTLALAVYFLVSMFFPAHETTLNPGAGNPPGNISGSDEKKADETGIA